METRIQSDYVLRLTRFARVDEITLLVGFRSKIYSYEIENDRKAKWKQ